MKSNTLLLISLLIVGMFALVGCDGSSGGSAVAPETSPGFSPDPDILPTDPPSYEDGPPEDLGDGDTNEEDPDLGGPDGSEGGDDGSGSGGEDGGGPGGDGQQPVPEPSTLLLVGSGITLITLCNRRKKNRDSSK